MVSSHEAGARVDPGESAMTVGARPGEATGLERARGRVAATVFGALVSITDLLPPRVRYGYVHRVTRRLLHRPLPSASSAHRRQQRADETLNPTTTPALTCVLAADHLDVGGIGSVIEMLARTLAAEGVRPVVVCHGDGKRAARLREDGLSVESVDDLASAEAAIRRVRPDVIQLHSATRYLEHASMASGLPLVTAMHNTEIHFTRARWQEFEELLRHSASGVAVSAIVRDFHAGHVAAELASRIMVIPNGAPALEPASALERARARLHLEGTLGTRLGEDVVFVSLVRYDAQKNVSGTVASFLRAVERTSSPIRLIIAGEPSDWAEYLRADGIRRSSNHPDRVHLLANSDAATLLAAGDAFVLNSFFEGWPVAATEAAAAGLPLLLSEVGGARELVARDPDRSVLIPNACGDASSVSDARARIARRQSRHQANSDAFVEAARMLVDSVLAGSAGTPPPGATDHSGVQAMAHAHAQVLKDAARRA